MAAVGRAAFTRLVIKAAVIGRSWSCRGRACSFWPGVRVQVLGGAINLGRGLTLTLMAFLGYEAYRNIPESLIVHADQKVDEIIDQADYLYGTGEVAKLYHLLIEHKNSMNGEILWRLARASRDLAQLENTPVEQKKQLTYEALEFAEKALEKNEFSFAAHKKAIELNPKDATSIHLMGLWCFTFAELPWVQQKIAAMFFATPPRSTYEEALQYFNKAEEGSKRSYRITEVDQQRGLSTILKQPSPRERCVNFENKLINSSEHR
ncbi:regulator of microtubule dynamics protein 1 isoform X4 [Scyliorhinus canicula]|uniref:regulator of microtubule dynamics protein 1 isoform X4 n=1 Tax=Scyliorhinus canicula TaxID=7830 RepID=UPI0018F38341|nr:regulator of microtubule dynamics protein 1 isoform X4 [Scyliorhinus canicula]